MMAKMAMGGNPMDQALVSNEEEGGGDAEPLPPNATMRQKIAAAGPKEKRKLCLVFGCAIATLLFDLLAVATMASMLGMIAFILGLVSVPFVMKNEVDVSTFAGKRDMFNKLREETNRMSEINDELHDNVDEVEANVERTKRITKKLGKICDGQSANVERLVELVKENGEIIKAMKENLAKSAVQTIIRVVLTGDEDRSFCIEENEVKKTALKVYIELEAQNIEIRLKEFQNAIREHPKLEDLVQMLKNVLDSQKEQSSGSKKAERNADYGFLVVDLDKMNKKEPESSEEFWVKYHSSSKFGPESGRRRWG